MIKHTPEFRKWVNRIAILSLTIGTVTMIILLFSMRKQNQKNTTSCEEWISKNIGPLGFEAEIIEKSIDEGNDCTGLFSLSVELPNSISTCECPTKTNFTGWIEEGDSLFKEANSKRLRVVKKGGESKSFDYPCCE